MADNLYTPWTSLKRANKPLVFLAVFTELIYMQRLLLTDLYPKRRGSVTSVLPTMKIIVGNRFDLSSIGQVRFVRNGKSVLTRVG